MCVIHAQSVLVNKMRFNPAGGSAVFQRRRETDDPASACSCV